MRHRIFILMSMSLSLSLAVTALAPRTAHAGSALWSVPTKAVSTITQSYVQAGGKGGLGEPVGSPTPWMSGCAQDYSGGRAKTAAIIIDVCESIQSTTPERPIKISSPRLVRGEFWDYAKSHTAAELGSPLGNDQTVATGRWQTFSGGTWGLSELYQARSSDQVYAVRDHIHDYYQAAGGPSGKYGWPVSEQYEWGSEIRQDFQYGSLVWRTEIGTRPLVSWKSGQVLMSPTVDPSSYLIRELGSYKIADTTQLNRCYGGASAITPITADELGLTQKAYPNQGTAPDCVTPQEQAAINWATNQLHTAWSSQINTYWSGRCETFVEIAYGTRARALSADENYTWRLTHNQIHTDRTAPAGALVFYGGSADGHVGISLGGNSVISTQGYLGDQLPVWQHQITGLANPYLGWSYVDNSWPR